MKRKIKPVKERLQEKIMYEPNTGCWIWTHSTSSTGYGQIMVDNKPRFAHRISYEIFKGKIPKNMLCCHYCDTPLCVNPDHLFIGTHKDNSQDMKVKGRWRNKTFLGEDHANSKLTKKSVIEIRLMAKNGIDNVKIGEKFGVTAACIWYVVHNKTWKNI